MFLVWFRKGPSGGGDKAGSVSYSCAGCKAIFEPLIDKKLARHILSSFSARLYQQAEEDTDGRTSLNAPQSAAPPTRRHTRLTFTPFVAMAFVQ